MDRIARLLFNRHSHGDMVGKDDVIYRQKDVIAILKKLGHTKRIDWKYTKGEELKTPCKKCGMGLCECEDYEKRKRKKP